MERLIEHDVTTPPKHWYDERAKGKANPEAFDREIVSLDGVPDALVGWARHIAWLATFLDAGAHVGLDDLRPEEWRGLALWRNAQAAVRGKYQFCPKCSTALVRGRKMCPWCKWVADGDGDPGFSDQLINRSTDQR
jgi:hypothetical protein